jgi:3-hydroxy-9,10-secoandrosta-1,3,5(10)-triene-9,17-dione monooxygenase
MVPRLRAREEECEALGRMPDATTAELTAAGFYRILEPRRFGGYELDLATFSRVVIELSRGCPSTGWAFAFAAGQAHMLAALFSEECQREIFGAGEVRMPGNVRPAPAVPVDGGLRLSGAWDYVSGCDSATHFLLGAECSPARAGAGPTALTCIVDAGACAIVDNWNMHGLRGTGSRRVVADAVFVPAHRTIRSLHGIDARLHADTRDRPGRFVHANPMYAAGGIFSVFFGQCTAVAVGIAQGALDLYETRFFGAPPRTAPAHLPHHQRCFGEALARVDVARDALLACDRDHAEWSRRDIEDGEPFSAALEQRLMLRMMLSATLCADAVEAIVRSGGSSALRRGSAMERRRRDMTTLMTHPSVQLDANAELYARLRFGSPPP